MSVDDSPLGRWRRAAGPFTDVVASVPADGWNRPSPCDGWVARDIVRHLAEWVPSFLADGGDIELAPIPSVDDDPAAAWRTFDDQLAGLLRSPRADDRFAHPQAGEFPLATAVDRFVTSDVVVHTWDLATATGQTATLDDAIVTELIAGMEPITDMLVQSGHYREPVRVGADADPTTRLVALTGRNPAWKPPT